MNEDAQEHTHGAGGLPVHLPVHPPAPARLGGRELSANLPGCSPVHLPSCIYLSGQAGHTHTFAPFYFAPLHPALCDTHALCKPPQPASDHPAAAA